MSDETTIPLFPCGPLGETLDFYRALGFEVTHEQARPYVYGAVRRGGFDLHFHGAKGPDAKTASGMCLVIVPEVEPYHRAFADGLRARYGKVPTAGLPRVTRLRPGQTSFTVFDPSGNSVIFIRRGEPDPDYDAASEARSRLGRAVENAAFLRDTYSNDKAAAKVLDSALAEGAGDPVERARALAARAELAVAMGDAERARAAREELRQIPLSDEDRQRLRGELQAADEVERWVG